MNQILISLSLLLPAIWLLLAAFFPHLDPEFEVPLLHFYVVTFFTFAAAVVTFFTAVALGQNSKPRHQLLATAFAVMGTIFFLHGVTTRNALILTFNPGIRWAAWLTVFLGGMIFATASLDTPKRPLPIKRLHLIHWALAIFCTVFALIVALAPHWLAAIDVWAAPWHQQLVYAITLLIWLFSALRLHQTWRQTRHRVDGVMALITAWFAMGTISLHGFDTWRLSWWLYHGQLLLGVITAVWALSRAYEQLRQFRLTTYYAAIGLIVTGGLALLTSHLVSQLVERSLQAQILSQTPEAVADLMAAPETIQIIINARRMSLLIAGLTIGLLFLIMMIVVNRADKLIGARNQELAQTYADLQAVESMRDDLTDMIVHDLRTPLTSIRLSLDLIEKVMADSDQHEHGRFMDNARDSVQQMLSLVNQILDVARLEAGRLQLNYESLSLTDLLLEKARLYAPQAESGHKHFHVKTAPDLPTLKADKALISRVLDNLISNALKYTRVGGNITLRTQLNSPAVLVQVTDDGEGIAPETKGHIFDKFYQVVDEEGKPIRRGTGLGLTFCKLVVEAHHGRIWVDSQPGQGSTFSFTLPLNKNW